MKVSAQKQRDERAQRLAQRFADEQASPERVLALLREIANDRRYFHYAPHLVTAIRKAQLLPGL